MRAGDLDQRITIEESTPANNSVGEPVDSWSTFAEVWARMRDVRAQERFQAQAERAEVTTVFSIRYLDGLKAAMRIQHAGDVYDIQGITRIGRNEMLEILATAQVE